MGEKVKSGTFVQAAFIAAVTAMLGACIAPDNSYLMELNRNGKWAEAERIGRDMLANRRTFTHSELCETYFHVIYAKTRLGRKNEAIRLTADYDAFSVKKEIDPKLKWLDREIAKLKDELGLLDEARHTLISAMEENGKGNYEEARKLCGAVLAMESAGETQKATAHFVASVCSVRLNDLPAAEAHLAAFDSLKSTLPPGHQALMEEAFLRRGLNDLKQSTKNPDAR